MISGESCDLTAGNDIRVNGKPCEREGGEGNGRK